jgi:hypothetical protein
MGIFNNQQRKVSALTHYNDKSNMSKSPRFQHASTDYNDRMLKKVEITVQDEVGDTLRN